MKQEREAQQPASSVIARTIRQLADNLLPKTPTVIAKELKRSGIACPAFDGKQSVSGLSLQIASPDCSGSQ